MRRAVALLALSVYAAACARPPAVLRGSFVPLTVPDARALGDVGERVRWGGTIVETRPAEHETCVEVVGRPLDDEARPRLTDETDGRFVACSPGFFDPAVYAAGRELTVAGTVAEPVTRRV